MADLEQRVTQLEREVREIRAGMQTTNAKVEAIDNDMEGIPGLIRAESRLADSRSARVMAEIADLRAAMDNKFDAVLRAVAEIVAEGREKSG